MDFLLHVLVVTVLALGCVFLILGSLWVTFDIVREFKKWWKEGK